MKRKITCVVFASMMLLVTMSVFAKEKSEYYGYDAYGGLSVAIGISSDAFTTWATSNSETPNCTVMSTTVTGHSLVAGESFSGQGSYMAEASGISRFEYATSNHLFDRRSISMEILA